MVRQRPHHRGIRPSASRQRQHWRVRGECDGEFVVFSHAEIAEYAEIVETIMWCVSTFL